MELPPIKYKCTPADKNELNTKDALPYKFLWPLYGRFFLIGECQFFETWQEQRKCTLPRIARACHATPRKTAIKGDRNSNQEPIPQILPFAIELLKNDFFPRKNPFSRFLCHLILVHCWHPFVQVHLIIGLVPSS